MTESSIDTDFASKLNELKEQVGDVNKSISSTESSGKCIPWLPIAWAVLTLLCAIILSVWNPKIVQEKQENSTEPPKRSFKKISAYTFLFAVFFGIGMFMFSYCQGNSTGTMMCGK